VFLWNDDAGDLLPAAARTRSGKEETVAASRTLLEDVVQKREGVLVVDGAADERYSDSASFRDIRIRSAIAVPMLFQEKVYGILQLDSTRPGEPFGRSELMLLLGIASQVGMSLAYAGLHARELERELFERDALLARKIQRHFLPRNTPSVEKLSISVEYSPALAVGGDFYYFLDLADGRVGVAVGDVSGKGVSAALYVAKLSSDLRYHAAGETDPARIMAKVNQAFTPELREGMFITLVLMSVHAKSGELALASAGHPLPILRTADGQIRTLGQAGDPPLGLAPEASFQSYRHGLGPQEVVILYTDGITEAAAKDKEVFGVERMYRAVLAGEPTGDGVAQSLLTAVKSFTGAEPQSDDITLVCVGREEEEPRGFPGGTTISFRS
jgi:serine phosphatase RsbU (regulator of sigma subunit)